MTKKRRLQIQRKKIRVELPPQEDQTVYFFRIFVKGDEIQRAQQVPDFPFDGNADNSNLLSFPGQGFAIHVTWYPEKPAPGSELRYEGYLAIIEELGKRDPQLAKDLKRLSFGFGHAEGASLEWHQPRTDD